MGTLTDMFFGGAERKAADTQAGAAKKAADLRMAGFNEAVAPRVAGLENAATMMQPYAAGGQDAHQMQLAQSGALGPEAQQQFFDNFNTSPGTQFKLDQAQRFVDSGGDQFGGSGGGNRMRRLQEIGLGLIQNDLTTQFNQLGTLSNRGYAATGQIAGIESAIGDVRGRGIEGAAGVEGLGVQQSAAAQASGRLGQAGAVRGTVGDIAKGVGMAVTGGLGAGAYTSTTTLDPSGWNRSPF